MALSPTDSHALEPGLPHEKGAGKIGGKKYEFLTNAQQRTIERMSGRNSRKHPGSRGRFWVRKLYAISTHWHLLGRESKAQARPMRPSNGLLASDIIPSCFSLSCRHDTIRDLLTRARAYIRPNIAMERLIINGHLGSQPKLSGGQTGRLVRINSDVAEMPTGRVGRQEKLVKSGHKNFKTVARNRALRARLAREVKKRRAK
ncbi:hypothetical protein B0H16DRAFT_1481217 [Mycena metata]|uniref:Uncharacterized protein n=1 Tax=Mycena metata TaxID=1033252 RepID=A0AAD7GZ33_9AGAR|nr:hypothetical protein B0H16DRAFT_1481217 [Mycena metata]